MFFWLGYLSAGDNEGGGCGVKVEPKVQTLGLPDFPQN